MYGLSRKKSCGIFKNVSWISHGNWLGWICKHLVDSLGHVVGSHGYDSKGKGCPHSIAKRRVLELILVLGSQPAGDVSHKSGGRLPLLSARPAVTLAALELLPICLRCVAAAI